MTTRLGCFGIAEHRERHCFLRRLTFELRRGQRQDARPAQWAAAFSTTRACRFAVGPASARTLGSTRSTVRYFSRKCGLRRELEQPQGAASRAPRSAPVLAWTQALEAPNTMSTPRWHRQHGLLFAGRSQRFAPQRPWPSKVRRESVGRARRHRTLGIFRSALAVAAGGPAPDTKAPSAGKLTGCCGFPYAA